MSKSFERYEQRLLRVTDYLHQHLGEELDLNRLAEVACMSAFHWHRLYRAVHGESVVATVKRLRLHRAAHLLSHTQQSISQIGKACGYPNLQSFTRIFAQAYGLPPAAYRSQGLQQPLRQTTVSDTYQPGEVGIVNLAAQHLLTVAHRGPYMEIGRAFEKVLASCISRQLFEPGARWYGVYFDDSSICAPAQLQSLAGLSVSALPAAERLQAPLQTFTLRAGRYAVLRYRGPYSEMHAVYHWLYGQWLANSAFEAADAPVFEEYLNNPRDTAPPDLLTDIYLPLAD